MRWITDRLPMESDADSGGFIWITTKTGVVFRIDRVRYNTEKYIAWMPITEPQPYVKPTRYRAHWSITEECWVLCYNDEPIHYYRDLDDWVEHMGAAEKIAAVHDEVMPELDNLT